MLNDCSVNKNLVQNEDTSYSNLIVAGLQYDKIIIAPAPQSLLPDCY